MPPFTHLHVHSQYSLLDGAGRVEELVEACALQDMRALALTDHGVMYGVVDFYKAAKARGIQPVLGCEVYVAPRDRREKDARADKEYAHLVLLARDNAGYRNLMKLVSIGFLEGFYYKPRIDYELLEQYAKGLTALSACLAGDIPRYLAQGREREALELARRFSKIMGEDNFFIELQDHGIPEQKRLNPLLIDIANKAGVGLVATNDVHYVAKEDAEAQDVLMCIQTGKFIDEENRMRFSSDEFYLKSPDEMASLFDYVPEALSNTAFIASRCDVGLEFGCMHMPGFTPPGDTDNATFLRRLCEEGLRRKYEKAEPVHEERLRYELNMIEKMAFVDYFLIVWDFIRYAKERGIMVGPGRGSAAGSIVAYALDITNVDPLRYGLLFERFLNPERISMPDIDIDFCYERRQEVIDYVVEKYGEDHVAQIITFGTMAARAAIRDVGRVLRIPYGEVDAIAKMVPSEINISIDRALLLSGELRAAYENDPQTHKLLDMARKLEGLPRHASTHAAGVVISKEALTEYVPLQRSDTGVTTQFPMGTLEELGLLKMDFLGLRTLTVIRDTVELVERCRGIKVDPDALDFEDAGVYEMLGQGDTDGVFQLESQGMRSFLRELKPGCFEDVIAGISLYRPGPMDQIPQYVACKNDPSRVRFAHPALEKVLGVTYGCIVYQEQVMQIVRELAGYSLGRSDLVRRAMSKKKADIMGKERHIFLHGLEENGEIVVPGALRNGVPEKTANEIFDQMMDFAQYAFNKSHAAAYGVVAYQTAYLKRHYPQEFMTALINSFMGTASKVAGYIHACGKKGIQVLPPDINKSMSTFSPEAEHIRFGLGAIRNVGAGAAHAIIAAREKGGPFTSFTDFIQRLPSDVRNKRMIESLIKAGCFDALGYKRIVLMSVYEKVMDACAQDKKRNIDGQISLFDMGGEAQNALGECVQKESFPDMQEFEQKVLLSQEKEMTGLYLSGHPLSQYRDAVDSLGYSVLQVLGAGDDAQENPVKDGSTVRLGGIVTQKKRKTTKTNQIMAYITLEDLYAAIEMIVFPSVLTKYAALLEPDMLVAVTGRVSVREEESPQVIVETVVPLEQYAKGMQNGHFLCVTVQDDQDTELLRKVLSITKRYKGETPLTFKFMNTGKAKRMPKEYHVIPTAQLQDELGALLGSSNIKYV
ncbi:MAG: DNA polymerase III subunit alpha [Bacillota bacterium]